MDSKKTRLVRVMSRRDHHYSWMNHGYLLIAFYTTYARISFHWCKKPQLLTVIYSPGCVLLSRFLFLCICLLFVPFPFQLKQIIFLQTRVERQTCLVAVLENRLLLQRTCLTNLTENTFFFSFFRLCSENRVSSLRISMRCFQLYLLKRFKKLLKWWRML